MRHFGHPIYILPEGEDENSPGRGPRHTVFVCWGGGRGPRHTVFVCWGGGRGPRHTVFVCWGGGRSEAQSWVPSPNRLNRPAGQVRYSNSLTERIGDLH